jgi:hypothetical protein
MLNLLITTIIITVLLSSGGSIFLARENSLPKAEVQLVEMLSKDEARKLWEKAIQAKDGREKLLQVKSLAQSSTYEYITHKGKRNTVTKTEFFVFPDKFN